MLGLGLLAVNENEFLTLTWELLSIPLCCSMCSLVTALSLTIASLRFRPSLGLDPWPWRGSYLSTPVHYKVCKVFHDEHRLWPSLLHGKFILSLATSQDVRNYPWWKYGQKFVTRWCWSLGPRMSASSWLLYIIWCPDLYPRKILQSLRPWLVLERWPSHVPFIFTAVNYRTCVICPWWK